MRRGKKPVSYSNMRIMTGKVREKMKKKQHTHNTTAGPRAFVRRVLFTAFLKQRIKST